jgi:hypothetical protein
MSTENRSPSYNALRDFVRKWTSTTKEGDFARQNARLWSRRGDASHVFDDDHWTNWKDWWLENRNNLAVARENVACQEAFRTGVAPEGLRFQRFCRIPTGYHFRRIAETGNPEYWNDRVTVLREVMENPWFATVPLDRIRAELENVMPKGKTIAVYDAMGNPVKTAEESAADEPVAVIPVPMNVTDLSAASDSISAA